MEPTRRPAEPFPTPRRRNGHVAGGALLIAVAGSLCACGSSADPAAQISTPKVALPHPPGLLFNGGFDSGNTSAWDGVQQQRPGRVRVVRHPTDHSRFAARFEVRRGDFVANGERAEVSARGCPVGARGRRCYPDKVGSTRWYAWSSYFPRSFKAAKGWELFLQWKGPRVAPPALAMGLQGNRLNLQHDTPDHQFLQIWSTPLVRGRWLRFVAHIKFWPSRATGFVSLWYNGRPVVRHYHVPTATLSNGTSGTALPNYLKVGLYRKRGTRVTQVVYNDNLRIGASRRAVTAR